MENLAPYLPDMLDGLRVTVIVAALSIAGCAFTALTLGILRTLKSAAVRYSTLVFIELMRGASVIVYLFWLYYALPAIPGVPQLSAFTASVLVLSIGGGVYGAEIVRGGIEAIPRSQWDACRALGLSRFTTLFRVVLPQALSQIVPAFGSLSVDLVKWTSIVGFVGVHDLFYIANAARTMTNETVVIYSMLVLVYWGLCTATGFLFRGVEFVLPLSRSRRTNLQPVRAGALS